MSHGAKREDWEHEPELPRCWTVRRTPGIAFLASCAVALFALPAGAEPGFQLSASVGLGEFTAGAGPPRFAVVPTGSFLLLRGERWLLRCDDAVTLLGTTGGRFGAANATTLSFGARWEAVNVSAGLSLAEYSLIAVVGHSLR